MNRSSPRSSRPVTVHTVLIDIVGPGVAADGTAVRRFKRRTDADACAARSTCYGSPATVDTRDDVPRHLADRWGVL